MKRKASKPRSVEQIIRILRQADGGQTVAEICREHNIAEGTFYRWKKQYGGMEISEAKRLKALEKENTELKKMLAEAMLDNRVLKEINSKKGKPVAQKASRPAGRRAGSVLAAAGLWHGRPGVLELLSSTEGADGPAATLGAANYHVVEKTPTLGISVCSSALVRRRLDGQS
jgi:putative transposase